MNNQLVRTVCLILFAALCGAPPALSQKKRVTVHGDIVEILSYVKEGIKPTSPAGKEIALSNLRKGGSLAIIEKGTNKVYIVSPSPADTAFTKTIQPYLGIRSFIKGTAYTRSGMRVIEIGDIGKSLK